MDLKEVEKFAKSFFLDADTSHDWEHVERVLALSLKIADKENADKEVVAISALLHDIARKQQDDSKGKICHAEKGAEIAKQFKTEFINLYL